MIFKNLYVLVLWTKVALALEGLSSESSRALLPASAVARPSSGSIRLAVAVLIAASVILCDSLGAL